MKEEGGGGEGKEGNAFPYFLPRRLPVLLFAPICAWSLTLVLRSLLRNQMESLLHRLFLLQTLNCHLIFMEPFTHLVLQSLQCFSKVVHVHFSVNTEASETDSNNGIYTDSQNEFKNIISIATIVTIITP